MGHLAIYKQTTRGDVRIALSKVWGNIHENSVSKKCVHFQWITHKKQISLFGGIYCRHIH